MGIKQQSALITNKTDLDHNRSLPSLEEYNQRVLTHSNTRLGYIFPVIPSEHLRVFLASLCFFTIGLSYSFAKQFKDTVIFDVFHDAGVVTWFELLIFIPSYQMIRIVDKLVKRLGINKGSSRFMLYAMITYTLVIILILSDRFITSSPGWASEIFYTPVMKLRSLSVFYYPVLILSNPGMSFFYIMIESINVYMVSCLFMSYLSSNTTHAQTKRYLHPIIIGANMSLYFSVLMVNALNSMINKSATVNNKWGFYIISILILQGILALSMLLKKRLDREFNKELYVGSIITPSKPEKKEGDMSLKSVIYALKSNKWLLSISMMAMCYNAISTFLSLMNPFIYSAHAKFYQENPLANKEAGFIPTSTNVSMKYRSIEGKLTSLIAVTFVLFPVFKQIFNRIGIFGYNFICVVFCCTPMCILYGFISINYPYTNYGERILLNLGITSKNPRFEAESTTCAMANVLSRVGKYSFYDIIKENITARIDPMNKIVYKGIFDGLCPKIGKIAGTLYALTLSSGSRGDMRYYAGITSVIFVTVGVIWASMAIRLHKAYRQAEQKDEYLGDTESNSTHPMHKLTSKLNTEIPPMHKTATGEMVVTT